MVKLELADLEQWLVLWRGYVRSSGEKNWGEC